jgi:peptidyl-prolyl cis-trans isomerase C
MTPSKLHRISYTTAAICALWFSGSALAQNAARAANAATVNGQTISSVLLEQVVSANISQGQADSPELRQILLEELINRELVAQDAVKKGLDKTPQAVIQLQQARQAVLVDLAIADYFAKNPINDAALQAEYKRQIDALTALGPLQQYQLRLLVLPTEAQAREAIRNINQGRSMEEIVRKDSTDPTSNNGGLMDWLLPSQLLPVISNVVVNLSKGQVTAAPILTQGGWNVIRVENTRPFVPPKMEESTEQLRASLVQQRRSAYLTQLREAAKISRP